MIKVFLKRSLFLALLGLAAALGISFMTTPQYEAQAVLLVGEQSRGIPDQSISQDVQKILDAAGRGSAATEVDLLKSRPVFLEALRATLPNFDLPTFEDYYKKFNVIAASAENPNQQSSVAIVSVRAATKDEARDIVRNVIEAYDRDRTTMQTASMELAKKRVEGQIASVKIELRDAEKKYQAYMETQRISDPMNESMNNLSYRRELLGKLESAEASMSGIDASISVARSLLPNMPKMILTQKSDVRNPSASEAESILLKLRAQKAQELVVHLPDHISVRLIDDQIKSLEATLAKAEKEGDKTYQRNSNLNDIRHTIESQLEGLKIQKVALAAQIADYRSQMAKIESQISMAPAKEVGLSELKRNRMVLENKVGQLEVNLAELDARLTASPLKSQLIGDEPYVNENPVEPNFVRNIMLGILAGLCLALLYSFAVESINPRVYSANQVQMFTGLPVAASLPSLKAFGPARLQAIADGRAKPAESFRYLASTSLASPDTGTQVVMFTGIGRRSGTTASALQYAVAMSQSGKRVLLIDADPRRRLTRTFKAEAKAGFNDLLESGASTSVGYDSTYPNMKFMPFGTLSRRPSDFTGENLEDAMSKLRGQYDLIVIDAAPSDVLADASRLAKFVDETMVVFSAMRSSLLRIPTIAQILSNAGAKGVSLVMTNSEDRAEPFTSSDSIGQDQPALPAGPTA